MGWIEQAFTTTKCRVCGGTLFEVFPIGWQHVDGLAVLDHDPTPQGSGEGDR